MKYCLACRKEIDENNEKNPYRFEGYGPSCGAKRLLLKTTNLSDSSSIEPDLSSKETSHKEDPDECLFCHEPALTAEHKHKKSQLSIKNYKDLIWDDGNKIIGNIQGPDSKFLKFKASLCFKCNGHSSAPADKEYSTLDNFLKKNPHLAFDVTSFIYEKSSFSKVISENPSSILEQIKSLRKKALPILEYEIFNELKNNKVEEVIKCYNEHNEVKIESKNINSYFSKILACQIKDEGKPVPKELVDIFWNNQTKAKCKVFVASRKGLEYKFFPNYAWNYDEKSGTALFVLCSKDHDRISWYAEFTLTDVPEYFKKNKC